MGIKHLDQYLERHLQTLPLTTLSETRLGIDASHYLSTLLEDPKIKEPLLSATGGLPLTLTTRVEADLRTLEKVKIKPVFVFNGLNPSKRFRAGGPAAMHAAQTAPSSNQAQYAEIIRERKQAWENYEKGNTEVAKKMFKKAGHVVQWDVWRSILRIFRNRNVEFIIAPYFAWAQLIYLLRHAKSYVHSIYGPTEALLYPNMDKIITSIDLAAAHPTFTFVQKRSILGELGLTEEQFLDAGILSGFEHCPTFPPLTPSEFKQFVDLVKTFRSGYLAIMQTPETSQYPGYKQAAYVEQFARARAMIKFSLILNSDGNVTALPIAAPNMPPGGSERRRDDHIVTLSDVPSDMHEVFTSKLPDEIYFYLSRGLIGPQALVWLTTGQVIEPPPLDNGETNEYRRFIQEVITDGYTGPRAVALALISSALSNPWTKVRISPQFWFEGGNIASGAANGAPGGRPVPHSHVNTGKLIERVSGWAVRTHLIEEELRRQSSSTIDFALCLGATSEDSLASRTKSRVDTGQPLEKKDEVVANCVWRFLELRGFLQSSHNHSPWAKAMHAALVDAKVNDKFQDPLYLFLELVRAGVMHGNLWSNRAFSGGPPNTASPEERRSMLLVMRVMSIVPLSCKPQPWYEEPVSKELLAFNSFVKSLSRALRTLIEATLLNMFLKQHVRRQRDDYLDIALSLPFQTDVNTGYGILIKVYLDCLAHEVDGTVTDPNQVGVREAKEEALNFCDEMFGVVKNPKNEVHRGFRFWDAALTAIRVLNDENGMLPELYQSFEAADRWLRPMRPEL